MFMLMSMSPINMSPHLFKRISCHLTWLMHSIYSIVGSSFQLDIQQDIYILLSHIGSQQVKHCFYNPALKPT